MMINFKATKNGNKIISFFFIFLYIYGVIGYLGLSALACVASGRVGAFCGYLRKKRRRFTATLKQIVNKLDIVVTLVRSTYVRHVDLQRDDVTNKPGCEGWER